jgi:Mrp family chromosome partitioning ATPase
MRVYVRIGQGAEELKADLERLPAKQRAERLRILASIGLSVINSESREGDTVNRRSVVSNNPPDEEKSAVAANLLHSLGSN